MKKAMAFILSGLMMTLNFPISTAYAMDDKTPPTTSEIVDELQKYEAPYYGENFDFDNDGTVNVFDMIALRKKLIAGESGITISTAVKLEHWLLGKEPSLGITDYPTTWFDPSEYQNDRIKNLMSNDFRFVKADEGSIHHSNGDVSSAVALYFLGIDEYVMESIFVYNFCNSKNEFDEFIEQGNGFSIGIKNGKYALALNESE